MKRARVNGVELEYEVQGSGEPVILLHGGLLADENTPLMSQPALTGRYRVINYHRRGFAGSERPSGKATIEDQAADCQALMQHLGVRRAHVVGHSLGGVIAIQLAYANPASVHSLALMEPALMGSIAKSQHSADAEASQQKFREGMAKVNEIYASGDKRGALQAFLQTRAGEAFRDVLDFLLKSGEFETAVRDADTFLQVEMPASYRWEFSPKEASQLKVPVLSILGSHSPVRAQKVEEFLVSWIPHTEKLVLPGAEHALPLMDPPGIAAALATWFAKHPMQVAQYSMPASA
jgi:pimeloyl-ACP methyl ester carboxylesterase